MNFTIASLFALTFTLGAFAVAIPDAAQPQATTLTFTYPDGTVATRTLTYPAIPTRTVLPPMTIPV
ncbi:hypothetical protein D9613_006169 [Agrocybe pediades]|uniref:Uncharacterized protein n=1 Tax=Agrocybe pediades TaxID=84607 RepID=A0A8H4QV62_9AGAR|nr:hypothetical protein D9613_006169 [Agrocybe pediades]